jgi:hypothetical protein
VAEFFANRNVIDWIVNLFPRGRLVRHPRSGDSWWYLRFNGSRARELYESLYYPACVCLERKRKTFEEAFP